MIFFGLGAAIYNIVMADNEEGFQDQSFDLESFLNIYKVKEVCEVFAPVYEAEVNAERANGTSQRSDSEARERANANLKGKIVGGPLECPVKVLSASEDLRAQRDAFKALPDTFLVTVYGTLLYSTVNLQMTYNKIVKTMMEANKAKAEGFEDICTPEEAQEKKKTQCKLPEEVTPEEKAKIEETYKTEITSKKATLIQALGKWMNDHKSGIIQSKNENAKELQKALLAREMIRKKNKDKGKDITKDDEKAQEVAEERYIVLEEIVQYLSFTESFMGYSMDQIIAQARKLIKQIDILKKKLEAGDTTLPQESFMDYFVSPLH
jgi:hypothetical protein